MPKRPQCCHPERRAQPAAEGSAGRGSRFLRSLRSAGMTTTQLVEMTKSYGQNDNYEAGRQKDIGLALIV